MASKPVDVMVVNFNTAGLLQPMFDALRRADSADTWAVTTSVKLTCPAR